jgi:hypothetical protein
VSEYDEQRGQAHAMRGAFAREQRWPSLSFAVGCCSRGENEACGSLK